MINKLVVNAQHLRRTYVKFSLSLTFCLFEFKYMWWYFFVGGLRPPNPPFFFFFFGGLRPPTPAGAPIKVRICKGQKLQ